MDPLRKRRRRSKQSNTERHCRTLKRKAAVLKQSNAGEGGALHRALRFLSYRSRSEAEVRTKLTQLGYPQSIAEKTLARLRDLSYLNDENFARSWAQSRAGGRRYGPVRIEQELRAKGVAPVLTRQIIRETFDRETERESAKKLLDQKFRERRLDEPKVVRRAVALLQRRGYSSEVIFDLLQHREED